MAREYRIVKSHRRIGPNWLVQEGTWEERTSNLSGRQRRVFRYVWEREFPTRRAAEAFVEAEKDRRKVRVTATDDAAAALKDALRNHLNPQAAAALANTIQVQLNSRAGLASGDWRVWRQQLRWLSDQLVEMLGGEDAYRRACREAGL
jgi:hypothetical protein